MNLKRCIYSVSVSRRLGRALCAVAVDAAAGPRMEPTSGLLCDPIMAATGEAGAAVGGSGSGGGGGLGGDDGRRPTVTPEWMSRWAVSRSGGLIGGELPKLGR